MGTEVIEGPASLPAAPPTQSAAAVSNGEAANLIQVIASAARDPNVDIEKMERLWAMHERMKNRAAEEAFNDAMNKAQAEMGRVSADATNPQTRSQYATYGKLDSKLRPIYTRNGFALSFDTGDAAPEGHIRVIAYVSHSAGHTRTYKADMPADGKGAKGGDVMTKTHAAGAAMSYGMRYLLKLIYNVAIGEDDNDGNDDGAQSRGYTSLAEQGRQIAMGGLKAFNDWFGSLTARQRNELGKEGLALRRMAREADQGGETGTPT